MSRVLVTGATGFVGRACLAPLVARGFDVHATYIDQPLDEPGVTWHHADLLGDASAAVRAIAATHLLHAAWYAVPGAFWTAPENLAWVRASLGLYEAFAAAGGTRVVAIGSCAEYAWSGATCRERETPIAPRTYYGTCKHALHETLAGHAARAGIGLAWARLFFLFGPHEDPRKLVANVTRTLLRGEVARTSPGTQRRDFMHIADAGAALAALVASTVDGPVNVASGTAVPVAEIIQTLAELTGGTVELGALPADPDPVVAADVRRLRDEVGVAAPPSLGDRLRETVQWWRTA